MNDAVISPFEKPNINVERNEEITNIRKTKNRRYNRLIREDKFRRKKRKHTNIQLMEFQEKYDYNKVRNLT